MSLTHYCTIYIFTYVQFTAAFDRFLEHVGADEIHIFGVGLGAYLAYNYAAAYPFRVLSMVLEDGFITTDYYNDRAPCIAMLGYTPALALRQYVLMDFPETKEGAPMKSYIREAVEYHKTQVYNLYMNMHSLC